ncbi:2-hydroxychromene-2-carboxylate isomerase [Variovorax sp. J22G21]|uniref:2-hydroxychromene-2-carboxylate isomerase n=1 Tax=Variovorax fucosicus TaxID=3053517 RepID=UPI002577949A|nr:MULTISPECIES: 2-hydroxychromene-2-carboxylate isomerase [unclassified Variovorax]MDM0041312.1 2-hydroxychromene-2-carboxylate isomerase [Variovorax sp. J22R193]MDM0057676.1 2-hydroxychromene-2-carboxylate isomerase [Variovorax sp. J22G47]MDM0060369.1 2-hydroxychromene-2-carboxylate isomerase [Variovorax sp. J22G21]
MRKSVDFFFDVGSPSSYLAWTQLPNLCASHGADLVYRPMLLGGVYQATGNASPATIPVKGRYTQMDYERHARRYGVPFQGNPHFPVITLFLMRAVTGIQLRRPEQLQQLLGCVFKALWIDALNLNEPQLTADILKAGGFDPAEIERLTQDPETKAALKATTEEAVKRGVFGAPTIFVGDQMFFGQDRMDFVREALVA